MSANHTNPRPGERRSLGATACAAVTPPPAIDARSTDPACRKDPLAVRHERPEQFLRSITTTTPGGMPSSSDRGEARMIGDPGDGGMCMRTPDQQRWSEDRAARGRGVFAAGARTPRTRMRHNAAPRRFRHCARWAIPSRLPQAVADGAERARSTGRPRPSIGAHPPREPGTDGLVRRLAGSAEALLG